ncbi:hypothetical protein [Escherichia coli]|nr:hypothetical protein [Escherichia coli]HAY4228109.1 hypothetical protein [Escherichia coli]
MAQSPACNKLPPGSPFVASRLKEAPGIASMTSFTGVDLRKRRGCKNTGI